MTSRCGGFPPCMFFLKARTGKTIKHGHRIVVSIPSGCSFDDKEVTELSKACEHRAVYNPKSYESIVYPKKGQRKYDFDPAKLKSALRSGDHPSDIATDFKINVNAVYYYARKYKIEVRGRTKRNATQGAQVQSS